MNEEVFVVAKSNLSGAILNLHGAFQSLEDELRSYGYQGKHTLITEDKDRLKDMIDNIYCLTTFIRGLAQRSDLVKKENEHKTVIQQPEIVKKENERFKQIEEMDFSVRTHNCLRRAGINTVEDLLNRTKSDLIKVRNLGQNSFEEVISKLNDMGFSLKPDEIETLENTLLLMSKQVRELERENYCLKTELSTIKKKYSSIGRPEKFNESQKKKIIELKDAGYTLDRIKDEMQCSKGLVHKILSEYKG
ncbi:MAG: hypothetical protein E7441_00900 [Ruminococcaceae bacterium]|nr:hypothetical protein [Oscillospiraceae bacterium]